MDFVKFGMTVMILEASLRLQFFLRKFGNKNLTDARTCEMEASLAQPRKCGNRSNHQNEEL